MTTEPRDTVRLLIADLLDPPAQLFDDTQLDQFLALESSNIKRAAAAALSTIAASEVLVSKVIRSQDLQTDGAAVARELRLEARDLRDQANADEETGEGFYVDIIEAGPGCVPELTDWPYVGLC